MTPPRVAGSWLLGCGVALLLTCPGTALAATAAEPELIPPVTAASEAQSQPQPTAPVPAVAAPTTPVELSQAAPVSAVEEVASESGEGTSTLEFYGFADFSYSHVLAPESSVARQFLAPFPTFYAGHLNLYMSASHGDRWSSLAEVRFTYSPLGEETIGAADGTFPAVETTTTDYAEQRIFEWGGIELQRLWVEFKAFDFLKIRGGAWFTPYGYWNDDHGSPTIIAVHRPFPIGDQIFPEKQTGLVAHGRFFVPSASIGYLLTLSNGRGPYDLVRDLDNNKAIGGRLYVEARPLGDLTVGASLYRGRYTASTKRYSVNNSGPEPRLDIYRTVDVAYEELSAGVDVRWLWQGLHVQAELMMNEGVYDDDHRAPSRGFDPRPAFIADYRRLGGYALIGYRDPWSNLMPYGMVEYSSYTNDTFAPPVTAWTAGLNFRPTPTLVLKAEFVLGLFDGTGSTGLGADDLPFFGAQAAWAF